MGPDRPASINLFFKGRHAKGRHKTAALQDGIDVTVLTVSKISKPGFRKATDGREKQRAEHNKLLMALEVDVTLG
jgi:hypothetical protein